MRFLYTIILFVLTLALKAEVKLPALVSDHMILQRGLKVPVWGWASDGATVQVKFMSKTYKAKTVNGKWTVYIDPLKEGGPYQMNIQGDGSDITIKDILIGDVWLCSGQSNMAYSFAVPRFRVTYADEIASSDNQKIRQILVERKYNSHPASDFKTAGWKAANPKNLPDFSATAYFFAKNLFQQYGVPIGLINASYGGTAIQSWLSEEGFVAFPGYETKLSELKDTLTIKKKLEENNEIHSQWRANTISKDAGLADGKPIWAALNLSDSDWQNVTMPALSDKFGHATTAGVFWLRKTIDINIEDKPQSVLIKLGRIDDEDETYFNGVKIGGIKGNAYDRIYRVPLNLLKPGQNVLTVRVTNLSYSGGMLGNEPLEIVVGKEIISLKGTWKFKLGMSQDRQPAIYTPVNLPAGLYNAMISPLIPYGLKGVIWYQGENNANNANSYAKLLPALIKDWREKWNNAELPFLFQQLPNYKLVVSVPSESQWAELREAQLKTLNEAKATAMAVGIDIGEADNIHPINKVDVGYRLSLGARKLAFGEKSLVISGPVYKSMEVSNSQIILSFEEGNGGLMQKGDKLKYFAIAGADQKFYWADAVIRDKTIVVSSDKVSQPVAVRYAWADNPEGCNLYNSSGLPATPFRTDDWKIKPSK